MEDNDLLIKAKKDFVVFLHVAWKYLTLPPPTEVQIYVAKFLADDSNGDSIIEAYRGCGKSYIASAFVVWKLWNDIDKKFLIVSASKSRADNFSTFCFQLMQIMPFLNHLVPTGEKGTRSSLVAWDVNGCKPTQSPSVTSKGITSLLQGDRADYIIPDDVESMENSATNEQREKLKEKCKEFDSIKKADEGHGNVSRIMALGTPQTFESVYHSMKGYKVMVFPARYPDEELVRDYEGRLCPEIEDKARRHPELIGQSTDPKRFTDEDLLDREMKVGKSKFQLQFMLNTALSDADKFPLKLSDLIVTDVAPDKAPCSLAWSSAKANKILDLPNLGFSKDGFYQPAYVDTLWKEYEGTVMSIDPSGRGKDDTAYAVVKYLHGMLFVVEAGGMQGGFDESTLKELAMVAKRNSVNEVIIESNFGGGMFSELFRPVVNRVHRCMVEEVTHSKQKELRIIDTLEPVMNQHRLCVARSVIEKDHMYSKKKSEGLDKESSGGSDYSLFYQMTHITKDKGSLGHDDALDALAIAVAYWTESMARDTLVASQDARDRDLERSLEKVYERIDNKAKRSGYETSLGELLGVNQSTYNNLDSI